MLIDNIMTAGTELATIGTLLLMMLGVIAGLIAGSPASGTRGEMDPDDSWPWSAPYHCCNTCNTCQNGH